MEILGYSRQRRCYYTLSPFQHGRVKIKSTAQQEEEKKKEREKKLKIYVAARDACFSKVMHFNAHFVSYS